MTTSQASGDHGGEEQVLVCEQCGLRQEPGKTFCEMCNTVLHWKPGALAASQSAEAASGSAARGATRPDATPPSGHAAPWDAAGSAPGSGFAPGAGTTQGPGSTQGAGTTPGFGPAPGFGPPRGYGDQDTAPGTPAGAGAVPGDGRMPAPGAGPNDDTMEIAVFNRPRNSAARTSSSTPDTAPAGTGAVPGASQPLPDEKSAAERARALLIPVADPQGEPERPQSVAPVLPGRPAPVRPEVRNVGNQEIYGGIACPWCGTPNQPDRHFCVRCAMTMVRKMEDEMRRRSWWRRLIFRNREVPWAGDRPRLRRQLGYILRWVAWAAVLALVVTGLFNVGTAVQAVRDHFSKRVSISPDSVLASRSYPKHGAGLAFDKVSNTWWGPGITEAGQGQWLEAHFQQPVTLLDIGITAGESTHADTLSKSALPHRIQAVITMDTGQVVRKDLVLDQVAGFQQRSFQFHDVSTVRFVLDTAYNTSSKTQVAIAEIEFFGPSQDGG
jgi:hypothetical protein